VNNVVERIEKLWQSVAEQETFTTPITVEQNDARRRSPKCCLLGSKPGH